MEEKMLYKKRKADVYEILVFDTVGNCVIVHNRKTGSEKSYTIPEFHELFEPLKKPCSLEWE